MNDHAIVSPSAAERWMECPGSVKLGKLFPDKSSDYADEGTLAHNLAKILLLKELKFINNYTYQKELQEIKTSQYYNEEMHDYCDDYRGFVMEKYHEAGDDAQIKIETRVDLDLWVPEGYGTVDVQIAANQILRIIDLKYGKGVQVDAEKNPQLMLYALGVLHENELLYDIEFVEIHIYQPRIDNYCSYMIAVKALQEWGENVLKPKAKKAFDGVVEFKAGKWCQFCKAKMNCKTLAEYNLQVAKEEFRIGDSDEELELMKLQETNILTDKQIAAIILRSQEFNHWLKAVKEYALEESVKNQKKWPGLKLVEGRSNRKISDEKAALKILLDKKYDKDKVTETNLLGITKLEKILGPKDFSNVLGKLIFKPPGAPTLVQASDKRPELNSHDKAVQEFKGEKYTDDGE